VGTRQVHETSSWLAGALGHYSTTLIQYKLSGGFYGNLDCQRRGLVGRTDRSLGPEERCDKSVDIPHYTVTLRVCSHTIQYTRQTRRTRRRAGGLRNKSRATRGLDNDRVFWSPGRWDRCTGFPPFWWLCIFCSVVPYLPHSDAIKRYRILSLRSQGFIYVTIRTEHSFGGDIYSGQACAEYTSGGHISKTPLRRRDATV
jgi:hypothetical protein